LGCHPPPPGILKSFQQRGAAVLFVKRTLRISFEPRSETPTVITQSRPTSQISDEQRSLGEHTDTKDEHTDAQDEHADTQDEHADTQDEHIDTQDDLKTEMLSKPLLSQGRQRMPISVGTFPF
jgi:hypothetical protein